MISFSIDKKYRNWIAAGLIFLMGIAAYHNCLHNEMFWDDDDFIIKNRYIKDWHYFPKFFTENMLAGGYLVSNYWRPMLLTVFSVAWHSWEMWLPGWHSLNITFHALDGILLYFILSRLFGRKIFSLAVALIFTAHPVHNEAIVYVNSLGDSLATFFVLSSLLLFIRFRQSGKPAYASRNYWFALLCFPCAVMSKETGFVLCGLLPLTDFLLLQKSNSLKERAISTLKVFWPVFGMAVYYIILRGTALNFDSSFNFYKEQNAFTSNIFLRLLTFFKACTQYAAFLFFPYQLRVERQMPWANSLFEWDVLLGALCVGFMIFCIFKFWRKRPAIAFGCAWFFIAIAPASNVIVPINAVLYEHFLYMPMIGIVCAVCWAAMTFADKHNRGALLLYILVPVLIVFCAINIKRNTDWRTAIGFYEQLVQFAPSYRVINNLGMEYADKSIFDKAEIWYAKAIALDPRNPVAYHNMAGVYRDTGRYAEAEKSFKKVLELDPNFIFTYRSLAELYLRQERYAEAKAYVEVLVRYDPEDLAAKEVLGMINSALTAKPKS